MDIMYLPFNHMILSGLGNLTYSFTHFLKKSVLFDWKCMCLFKIDLEYNFASSDVYFHYVICFSAQAAALNGGNKGPSNTNKTASPEAVLQAALLRIQNLERKYSVLQDKVSLKLHATFFFFSSPFSFSLFRFLLPFLPFHSFCSIFPPSYIFFSSSLFFIFCFFFVFFFFFFFFSFVFLLLLILLLLLFLLYFLHFERLISK